MKIHELGPSASVRCPDQEIYGKMKSLTLLRVKFRTNNSDFQPCC